MPRWLEQLSSRIHSRLLPLLGQQPPNHVLINSYQPGCGIMVSQQQQLDCKSLGYPGLGPGVYNVGMLLIMHTMISLCNASIYWWCQDAVI
jgi:hypothetical protein